MGRAGMPPQLRTVTAGAVGLIFLLGACGGAASDGPPTAVSDVSVTAAGAGAGSLPTDSPTDLVLPTQTTTTATAQPTVTTGIAALRGTLVPRHFPFPKDATPALVSADAKATTVALSDVTADDAIRYYRQSMPSAGYTFQQQNVADGQTTLTYVGYGQRVQIRAGGTGRAQEVTLVFTGE
ncbi:hypothetical protein FDG2_0791 [Candidatus Protofrankia californiensis]|uniref:Uncharacterized protein n=1 Tax=Candidatus Protofrankia californiensis TaxID=1839754 RepID=A0A1C3NUF9_9ACTN|nr:hypothetical protein FDG2_0791 [Candidatus Protofrankia californiensis]